MSTDTREVFGGKSFANLLKDIYNNQAHKKKQIEILINELRPLIQNVNEAAVIVPLIKDYLEVGVKNDEQLVKMAAVFQKYTAAADRADSFNKSSGGGGILTTQEKEELLKEVQEELLKDEDIINEQNDIEKELDELMTKSDNVKNEASVSGENNGI